MVITLLLGRYKVGTTLNLSQFPNTFLVYGSHGQDYIHVHHCKPISTTSTIKYVDPKQDMIVLCANCHAMVHRRKTKLLTLGELKNILQSK